MWSYVVECVDHLTYSRSIIIRNRLVSDKISTPIQKVRSTFANFSHPQRKRHIHLPTKWKVYGRAVRSLLFYSWKTSQWTIDDVLKLLVFDHKRIRSTARVLSDHLVSNTEFRTTVLGKNAKSINHVVNLYRTTWSRHVLHISIHRLPRPHIFAGLQVGWEESRGGQTKTPSSHWLFDWVIYAGTDYLIRDCVIIVTNN